MQKLRLFWNTQSFTTQQTLFLLLVAAIWMLSPALGILLFLFPRVRNHIVGIFHEALSGDLRILWIPMVIPIMIFFYAHPAPTDDLLKHLVSGVYHYHYRTLFWGSPRLMAGDLYIGFDHVASIFYAWLPPKLAYIPFQTILVIGFAVTLPIAFRRQMPDLPPYLATSLAIILTVLVWLLSGFVGRLISGRPEDDLALWAAAVFLLSKNKEKYTILWFLVGWLSVPMYWLSCVYFPIVFLAPASLKKRIAAFAILCLSFASFWGVYSHGLWLSWLSSLHTDIGDRVVGVAEDASAALLIESVTGGILLMLALLALLSHRSTANTPLQKTRFMNSTFRIFSTPESISLVAVIFAWFMIPDMIRYVDILGPLAAVMIARYANTIRFFLTLDTTSRPAFNLVGLLAPILLVGNTFHQAPMPDVHIPDYHKGQKVLTYFSAATYFTLYENPGIEVAPAMELGMTRKVIQTASFDLAKGKFDCAQMHRWNVRWMVTPKTRWSQKSPSCVHLLRLNPDGMSVWSVTAGRHPNSGVSRATG